MTEKLTIRKAESKDVDLLYNWSNDKLVREQSFISDEIPYNVHCDWFKNKLRSSKSHIFILEVEGVPASIVRFELDNQTSTIGISIDKEYRGKGLGGLAIEIGVETYFKTNNFPVLAVIKKENVASIKSFKKAGFTYFKDEKIHGIESVVYQLKKLKNG